MKLASVCERTAQDSWVRTQGSFDIHSQHTESEGYDRSSLELPGMQETFVRLLARLTSTPLIVVLVHGALPRGDLLQGCRDQGKVPCPSPGTGGSGEHVMVMMDGEQLRTAFRCTLMPRWGRRVCSQGDPHPTVLVSPAGGPVDVEWLQESPRVGAIMTAWYPGEMARALLPASPATLNPRAWSCQV